MFFHKFKKVPPGFLTVGKNVPLNNKYMSSRVGVALFSKVTLTSCRVTLSLFVTSKADIRCVPRAPEFEAHDQIERTPR